MDRVGERRPHLAAGDRRDIEPQTVGCLIEQHRAFTLIADEDCLGIGIFDFADRRRLEPQRRLYPHQMRGIHRAVTANARHEKRRRAVAALGENDRTIMVGCVTNHLCPVT